MKSFDVWDSKGMLAKWSSSIPGSPYKTCLQISRIHAIWLDDEKCSWKCVDFFDRYLRALMWNYVRQFVSFDWPDIFNYRSQIGRILKLILETYLVYDEEALALYIQPALLTKIVSPIYNRWSVLVTNGHCCSRKHPVSKFMNFGPNLKRYISINIAYAFLKEVT